MKLHRFYIEDQPSKNIHLEWRFGRIKFAVVDEQLIHQLGNVLRMKKGSRIIVFGDRRDGKNSAFEYLVEIDSMGKKEVIFSVIEEINPLIQRRDITLAMSVLKKENTEFVLDMCTQLGVRKFQLLQTERTIKQNFRMDRGGKILKEATEQSGFTLLPTLDEDVMRLRDYLDFLKRKRLLDVTFYLQMGAKNIDKYKNLKELILITGPEGGFTDDEIIMFKDYGLKCISLGNQTLRAETACVAAAANL